MDAIKTHLLIFANQMAEETDFVEYSEHTIFINKNKHIRILPNRFIETKNIDLLTLTVFLSEKNVDVIVRDSKDTHLPFYVQIHLWHPTGEGSQKIIEYLPHLAPLPVVMLEGKFVIGLMNGNGVTSYWLSIDMFAGPSLKIGNGMERGECIDTLEQMIEKRNEIQQIIIEIEKCRHNIMELANHSGVDVHFKNRNIIIDGKTFPFYIVKPLHHQHFIARFHEFYITGELDTIVDDIFKKTKEYIRSLRLKKLFK